MHTFTPQQKQWLADLRSGEFVQGDRKLTLVDGVGRREHCCLGVAAHRAAEDPACPITAVVELAGVVAYRHSGHPACPGDSSMLTGPARDYIGLSSQDGRLTIEDDETSLIELNDDAGLTFAQIADVIEYFAADLFVPTTA